MDCTRGERNRRAYLLISLIVLVCNAAATGRHFLFHDREGSAQLAPAGNPEGAGQPDVLPGARGAAAEVEAHNARQRFLLGNRMDINRATREEIADLPGISDEVAQRAVETRARIGGFRRPEDLLQVRGIKEKRLKKILPFLLQFPNN